ncbi:MAG TPA: hypothetical protein PLI01_00470 [Nitrospira sp.]|nr:hypothetical protein [Nitrospira sp.]HNA25233.1 hypothetical protein [Nitrospira sp.]HNI17523.1 hypothetical protein [Nitrospira sp.]
MSPSETVKQREYYMSLGRAIFNSVKGYGALVDDSIRHAEKWEKLSAEAQQVFGAAAIIVTGLHEFAKGESALVPNVSITKRS